MAEQGLGEIKKRQEAVEIHDRQRSEGIQHVEVSEENIYNFPFDADICRSTYTSKFMV